MTQLNAHIESEGARLRGVFVRRLVGREAISELFSFTVELVLAADGDFAGRELGPEAVPGADVCVVLERDGLEVRRIHGIITSVVDRLEEEGAPFRTYSVTIAPHAYRLSLLQTQEVFLGLTIPQLLKQKLEAHGLEAGKDFDLRLLDEKAYPKREIVVQHGESDLAFVSRLAEHVGISYFFEHGPSTDQWVFTDFSHGFSSVEGADEMAFDARDPLHGVYALELAADLIPGIYFIQDYNYRAPLLDPTGQHDVDDLPTSGGVVEYGSHVKTPEEAKLLAKIRAEERVARQKVYRAKSSVLTASAGQNVKLLDHPRLAAKAPLLLLEVEHEATYPVFGEATPIDAAYRNTFRAMPGDLPHRPARRTPRPRMNSVVTGIIQPGPGGEIGGVAMLDDEGRYSVQVHFDTASHGPQKSSHPMRMAQPFNGVGNGMHFPLLPGTEVLIAFANGDPDRPVIIGALPNPSSPSPVVANEAHTHRIRSSQGVSIEFGATVPGRK